MTPSEDISSKKNIWLKKLSWIGGAILLLFIGFYLLLQWSPVQNWLVDVFAGRLSKDFNTQITIDQVDIDFKNHILLKGIYVADTQGDTLIYADVFKTNLARSILSFLSKEAYINDVILEHGIVNIITAKGHSKSNLEEIFFNTTSDVPDSTSTKWKVRLSKVYLNDITVGRVDENMGHRDTYKLDKATLIVNPNSSGGILEVKHIDLQSPTISMERWKTGESGPSEENSHDEEKMTSENDENKLIVRSINIRDGKWSMIDTENASTYIRDGYFDLHHIELQDVLVNIENLEWQNGQCTFEPKLIQATSASGFELKELSAKSILLSNRKIILNDLIVKTKESQLYNDVELSFKGINDFDQFADKVFMKMNISKSKISLNEIIHFVPNLRNNQFIKQNRNLIASLDGEVSGRVNNLWIKNLALTVGNSLKIVGEYRARDLTNPEETLLNVSLREFRSNVETLKKIIPGFDPPAQFTRVGEFDFRGQFDGFYEDFVAYGTLNSELGSAIMDMRLDIEQGRELAAYSGSIELQQFNLGRWTSHRDLGIISGTAEVKNGRGLTASSAIADLLANISLLEYKKYQYEDIGFNGTIKQGLFDGSLVIDDANADIDFDGQIIYGTEDPLYNFKADVGYINLKQLNLLDRPLIASGEIIMDATDLDLRALDGEFLLSNIRLRLDDSLSYIFDTLAVQSEVLADDTKKLKVVSELVNATIEGSYDLQKIPDALMKMLADNYAAFYTKLNLPSKYLGYVGTQNFTFDIDIINSLDLFKIVKSPIDTLIDLQVKGKIDQVSNYFAVSAKSPLLKFQTTQLHGLDFFAESEDHQLINSMSVDSGLYAGQFKSKSLQIDNLLSRDTLSFNLGTKNLSDVVQSVVIGGNLFLEDEYFGLTLNAEDLKVLDENWTVDRNNKLLFGKNFLRATNMSLSNGEQFIYLNTINDIGLEIGSEYFDVEFVNEVWVYDKLNFRGPFDLYVRTDNAFTLEHFETTLHLDSFWINEDHYGELLLDASTDGIKQPISVNLKIDDSTKKLTADGVVTPKGFGTPVADNTYLDLEFQLDKYPAKIIEYWIGEGVENTAGLVDVYLNMDGSPDHMRMYGVGKLTGVETKVKYLGTTYQIEDTDIPITSNFIDLTEGVLIDKYGNRANAVGGLTHRNLGDLGLDVTLQSDHFLALDTDKYHGEPYYGHAIGDMTVGFTGKIDAPDIKIEGRPSKGSVLNIPLAQARALSEDDFVVFYEDSILVEKDEDREEIFKIKGVHVDMNVIADPRSEVRIIMDEFEDNIVTGRGNGNMQVVLTQAGDFEVYGDYVIDRGEYVYNFLIFNRHFDVAPGGTMTWTGDPFNAQINLSAEHNLNTSIYGFVSEYLSNNDLRQEAQKLQAVKVIMNMDGPLLTPNINFDLEFPNISAGPLANWANTKRNSLQDDQNALNRNIIGLLVSGTFLPDEGNSYSDFGINLGINNTAGIISGHVSNALTTLLRQSINGTFTEGLYIDVDYKQYEDLLEGGNDNVFSINPRAELFGGKVNVDFQNYYVRSSNYGNYYAEDLTVDWFIFNNRRLKLQAYQETDIEFSSRKVEVGIGLNYHRDFDRLFGKRKKKVTLLDSTN